MFSETVFVTTFWKFSVYRMENENTETIPHENAQDSGNAENVATNWGPALKSIRRSIDLMALKSRLVNRSRNPRESGKAYEKRLNLIERAIQIDKQLAEVKSIKDTAGWFTISEAEVRNSLSNDARPIESLKFL